MDGETGAGEFGFVPVAVGALRAEQKVDAEFDRAHEFAGERWQTLHGFLAGR